MGFIYTVTGYTPAYWNASGVSFFASWKEFAGDSSRLILVHDGPLPPVAEKKLLDEHVILIPASGEGDIRYLTWKAISEYHHDGTFVYWDGDSYFQDNVYTLFQAAEKKMVFTENLDAGMVGGPQHLWKFFVQFYEAVNNLSPGTQPQDIVGAFITHFPKMVSVQDNTWNFTALPSLRHIEGKLAYKGKPVRVVHPTGIYKTMPEAKSFFFAEQQPGLYSRWHSTMTKGVTHSFLKRVHHVEAVKPE
jgi:hypothetical protein